MVSRSALKTAVKNLPIWEEVGKEYRTKIKKARENDPFAKCLKDLMNNGKAGVNAYKQCAQQYKISSALGEVWTD